MAIVKCKNKKTGITYVYESESYWDKEKQQPRARRKLIGKIDEETGEIVPTRKKKDSETEDLDDVSDYQAQLKEKEIQIAQLMGENQKLKKEISSIKKKLEDILKCCNADIQE